MLTELPSASLRHCLQCEAHLADLVCRARRLIPVALPAATQGQTGLTAMEEEDENEGFTLVDDEAKER